MSWCFYRLYDGVLIGHYHTESRENDIIMLRCVRGELEDLRLILSGDLFGSKRSLFRRIWQDHTAHARPFISGLSHHYVTSCAWNLSDTFKLKPSLIDLTASIDLTFLGSSGQEVDLRYDFTFFRHRHWPMNSQNTARVTDGYIWTTNRQPELRLINRAIKLAIWIFITSRWPGQYDCNSAFVLESLTYFTLP